jgi:hypothetical protein
VSRGGWGGKRIGDDAFVAADGSTVVRKDTKVLVVDVRSLSAQVGSQRMARTTAGEVTAERIMGCWTGK